MKLNEKDAILNGESSFMEGNIKNQKEAKCNLIVALDSNILLL
jgi:hypothetical protein